MAKFYALAGSNRTKPVWHGRPRDGRGWLSQAANGGPGQPHVCARDSRKIRPSLLIPVRRV